MLLEKIKKDSRKLIILTPLFGLLSTILMMACPFVLNYVIDNIEYDIDGLTIFSKVSIIIAIYVLNYIVTIVSSLLINKFSIYYKTKLSLDLYDLLIDVKYETIINKQPLYLADRIFNSVEAIYNYYSNVTKSYIVNTLKVLVSLIIIAIYNYIIALVLFLVSLIYIGIYYILNKKLQAKCVDLNQKTSSQFANILAYINEVSYLKQTNRKKQLLKRLGEPLKKINKENINITNYGNIIANMATFIINVSLAVTSLILAIYFVLNKIKIGEYVMLQTLSSFVFPSIAGIVGANINARDIKASYEFITQELQANRECFGTKRIEHINEISFEIKEFKYENKELYNDLHWQINKGDKILLTGESGSGKSTLIKSILGYINLKDVFINGINIKELDINNLRSKIYYISQNVPIIPGTIKDNILLDDENANIERLINKKLSKSLLNGKSLNSDIYQAGNNISGGEKQKLALLRLYLANPEVIIMDESFSALDLTLKEEVIETLIKDFNDKTIIMVSHDTLMAKYFNKKYVLNGKKIVVINNEGTIFK